MAKGSPARNPVIISGDAEAWKISQSKSCTTNLKMRPPLIMTNELIRFKTVPI